MLGENFIHEMKIPGPKREYTLDFFLPDKNIVIEYDGHSKHYTEKGQEKHHERDNWLYQKHGIITVRIHRDETKLPVTQFSKLLTERIAKCA